MAERCDYCVAVWNGESTGTRLTFEHAMRREKRVKVYRVTGRIEILRLGGVPNATDRLLGFQYSIAVPPISGSSVEADPQVGERR